MALPSFLQSEVLPYASVTIHRADGTEPPLIRACAWCTPKSELEALNRQHPGQVTHTLCSACAARLEAEAEPTPAPVTDLPALQAAMDRGNAAAIWAIVQAGRTR
jgi:hypothetical protein